MSLNSASETLSPYSFADLYAMLSFIEAKRDEHEKYYNQTNIGTDAHKRHSEMFQKYAAAHGEIYRELKRRLPI